MPAAGAGRPLALPRLRPMMVVQEDRTLEEVLLRMQRGRLHLALVVDSERRTVGLVTLEDVLEALVGDIRDESDPERKPRRSRSIPRSIRCRSPTTSRHERGAG